MSENEVGKPDSWDIRLKLKQMCIEKFECIVETTAQDNLVACKELIDILKTLENWDNLLLKFPEEDDE